VTTVAPSSDNQHDGRQAPGRPRRKYRYRNALASPNGVNPIYGAALEADEAGINAIPASEDGKKRPFGGSAKWKVWQTKRTYPAQLKRWFGDGHRHGMGLVCGAVSGNLEMFESEGRAVTEGVLNQFLAAATEDGLGELIERIRNGYEERTPSGGWHWLYHCEEISGNLKLAQRPATPEELAENPDDKIKALIETRGEGGYVVCAPSHGPTHPTGKPWVLVRGGFGSIVSITPDEREDLHALARRFDRHPTDESKQTKQTKQSERPRAERARGNAAHERPGDDFNVRASWSEVLEPHGWSFLTMNKDGDTGIDVGYWCRPGKTKQNSACTNHEGTDTLKVFSTSTPFDIEGTHSKFDAYTILNHDGDHEAAAADLAKHGYGSLPSSRLSDWRATRRRGRPEEDAEEDTEEPPWASLLIDGATWLKSGSKEIEALWGNAQWVLAARRQPIVLAGESGSGKTTLTHHLIFGAIGVPGYETLLGMAVTPTEGNVLLLASDRPDQARLSMFRLMDSTEAWDLIEERLVVWQGPPPEDVGNNPFLLLDMARHAGATLVVPDSLKDMAVRLVDDNVGAAVNQAHQLLIADGRDVWVPHHLRKGGRQDKVSEITINDLYGSAHIFNGAGSVLLVDRCPTDYELRQLKSPNGEYPTLRYQLGADGSASLGGDDPFLFVVRQAGEMGISTKEVARAVIHRDDGACPDADVQKARRRLNKLEDEGFITHDGEGPKRRWVAV
jgi:Bifunctional DNA primase/polymerase, N-terminal/AAA domain